MSIFRRNAEERAPEVRVEGNEAIIVSKSGDEPDRRVTLPESTWA